MLYTHLQLGCLKECVKNNINNPWIDNREMMNIRITFKWLAISLVCLLLISTLVSCGQPSQSTMADRDTDGDGWSDAQELQAGTDYQNVDTDGDGHWDSKDANPLDSSINSQETKTTSVAPAI